MASVACDLADLAVFDASERVRLERPESTLQLSIPGALRRMVSEREAEASQGRYTAAEVRWHLPAALLIAPPPVGSALIDSSGERWIVIRVERASFGTRYVCWCRRLVVADGLHQRVSIERAHWHRGRFGEPRARWIAVQREVLVRIQPLEEELAIADGQRQVRVTHRGYPARQVTAEGELRLVADSTIYRVLGRQKLEQLDALPVLLLERLL